MGPGHALLVERDDDAFACPGEGCAPSTASPSTVSRSRLTLIRRFAEMCVENLRRRPALQRTCRTQSRRVPIRLGAQRSGYR